MCCARACPFLWLVVLVFVQIVRHLIGKGGTVITKMQGESGASLKFQSETDMEPGALGRRLEILGPAKNQNVALYQVCRKVRVKRPLPPL